MTRLVLMPLLCLVTLVGCAQVSLDLQAAQARAHAAQAAGLLSAADPLPMCLDYFAGAVAPTGPGAVLKPPFAGVVDLGTDLYIIDAMTQAGGASDALDQKCGGVAAKLLKNAGRRAPGL